MEEGGEEMPVSQGEDCLDNTGPQTSLALALGGKRIWAPPLNHKEEWGASQSADPGPCYSLQPVIM